MIRRLVFPALLLILVCLSLQQLVRANNSSSSPAIVVTRSDIAVGSVPVNPITADFNGDGKADIAVNNIASSSVSVLLGNGDGTFGTRTDYPAPVPYSVAAGDFNGDDVIDLAAQSNNAPGTVSIYLGNGGGTFTLHTTTSSGGALFIVSADVNHDGDLDLIAAAGGCPNPPNPCPAGSISVLLGNGDGSFQSQMHYSTGYGPQSLTTGDFNGDYNVDVAVAVCGNGFPAPSNAVSVLLGNGDGSFQTSTDYPTGTCPVGVITADFDGDTTLDLATGNAYANTTSVLFGNGGGTFGGRVDLATAPVPAWGTPADMNSDGHADLVFGDYSGAVSVFLSNANGTFQPRIDLSAGSGSQSVAAADFNADGRIDLVTANTDVASISILLQVEPDTTPPDINCAAADGAWHGDNVQIMCTAEDMGSGLANAGDAAFILTTNVAAGSETSNALTDQRTVCNTLGNCATAGPIGGNKVDKRAPTVTISSPSAVTYTLGQLASAAYTCADGGAGIASCTGTTPNGTPLGTGAPGAFGYSVVATDGVGHQTTGSVAYLVAYRICVLYDEGVAHKVGSTVPIKLTLCDVNGTNVSSESIALVATDVVQLSTSAPGPLQDSGNANPDLEFRFSQDKYIFNLSLKGYTQGTYGLVFRAAGDTTDHLVRFQVK